RIAEQLRGPAVDRQLVLQLDDPLACGHQLSMIGAGHARDLAAVDQLPPPPRIDSLRTDLQVKGDLGHWPARGHQIQDLPPELCRIALRHTVLHGLLDEGSSSNPTQENRGNIRSSS